MRVPNFQQQVNEAQVPSVQLRGGLTPDEAVNVASNQLGGLVEMVNAGGQAYSQYQRIANNARVSKEASDFQNDVNDYLYNPNTGLLKITGQNALIRDSGKSLVQEANDWFNERTQEKINNLANNEQRTLFNQNASSIRGQLDRVASQHLFSESQKFQRQAFDAEIQSNVNSVGVSYADLPTTFESLDKISAAALKQGQNLGWSEQQVGVFAKEQKEKGVISAINLMQANGDGAKIPEYYALTKNFLSAGNQAKVTKLMLDNNADTFISEIIKYKDDPVELDKYINGLKNPESPFAKSIGPHNIPNVLGRAVSYRSQYDRQVQTAVNKREADGKDALTQFKGDIKSGITLSSQRLSELSSQVQGTNSESEFQRLNKSLPLLQRLYSVPADGRETIINAYAAEAKTKGSDNPQEVKLVLDQMKEIHNTMLDKEKNDPSFAYSLKTGNPLVQVPTTAIVQGDVNALNILRDNRKKIEATNKSSGSVTGSGNPLSKQNIDEMTTIWKSASPNIRLQIITNLYKTSKDSPNTARDMIQAVAGKNNSYRLAASFNTRGLKDIALQITTGQDLLDKGDIKVSDAINAKAQEYLRGIAAPGSPKYNIYLDAINANYAYLAQKSEKLLDKNGKVDNKSVDSDLFDKAALNVTGGKFNSGFGGKNVVLRPHTVGTQSFRQQLEQFNSQFSREYGGSDRFYFMDLPLEQNPNNPYEYFFKDGAGYVRDKNSHKDPKKQTPLVFTVR
ncbi:hypothetical protein [Acinetobacter modestus]|uniref:hypothetical protein n=1 Tax=Acinetobacter modestus TaxID=1776740 RepID=UPI001F4A1DB5|nr:hypothetical protein [Acinetobacter modestus]MCH7334689.1 hypothetical protein [Acinetobacter modestus]